MRHFIFALLAVFGLATMAVADDDKAHLEIAGDIFRAGQTAVHDTGTAEDLFLAGETVRATAPVTQNAHVAGRWVTLTDQIGGDLYAAGMEVTARGPVMGDASLAGYEVSVADVGGDLRATGSSIAVTGPVAGYALLSCESLQFDGAITGDTHIAARQVTFGPDARVDGQLVLYEKTPGTLEVPEHVAPADRIERRDISDWDHGMAEYRKIGWGGIIARFLIGLIVVAGIAALTAAVIPQTLAALRQRLLDQPVRALWFGFLAQSVVIGAALLLAISVLGLLIAPAMVALGLLVGFAGYVVGVYAFGVALVQATGRPLPATWRDKAIAAAAGAVVAGLLGLIPFLGWIFVLMLMLAGVGAAVMHLLRPRFFT